MGSDWQIRLWFTLPSTQPTTLSAGPGQFFRDGVEGPPVASWGRRCSGGGEVLTSISFPDGFLFRMGWHTRTPLQGLGPQAGLASHLSTPGRCDGERAQLLNTCLAQNSRHLGLSPPLRLHHTPHSKNILNCSTAAPTYHLPRWLFPTFAGHLLFLSILGMTRRPCHTVCRATCL